MRRCVISLAALCSLIACSAHAQPPLLQSSVPGAFSVRYLTDRAIVSATVAAPEGSDAATYTLRVRLPERVQWGYLGRELLPQDAFGWDATGSRATVDLPFGTTRLHLGWAGDPCLPPESAQVPLMVGAEQAGSLRALFSLEGMEATGRATGIGPGIADISLALADDINPEAVSVTIDSATADDWRAVEGGLITAAPLIIGPDPLLTLRARSRNLTASPIERVVIENVRPATATSRVPGDAMPEGAVLVEAEDFSDAGGTPVRVEPGSHHDASGNACVFTFIGDGSWLEWKVTLPTDGPWDLYARAACGDIGAWRVISVDGETPAGLELVEFPGTGGWARGPGQWWLMRITGGEGQPGPLELAAGEHTIRMRGVLDRHLNMDYLLLAPH